MPIVLVLDAIGVMILGEGVGKYHKLTIAFWVKMIPMFNGFY